jgi:cytochrome c-type biogenesis protein CcmF
MIYSFVTNDYSIKYVQHYSVAVQPLFYKITSYWGGLDGSIMFWVFLLSIFGSTAIYCEPGTPPGVDSRTWSRSSPIVEMFFLFLMVIHNNPFDTFVAGEPD